jgi:hypothetical protein
MKNKIDNNKINKLRELERVQIIADLQEMVEKKDMGDYLAKGPYPRLQFINKFYLHAGLSHHYDENKISKGMEEVENQLMNTFDCDP